MQSHMSLAEKWQCEKWIPSCVSIHTVKSLMTQHLQLIHSSPFFACEHAGPCVQHMLQLVTMIRATSDSRPFAHSLLPQIVCSPVYY